MRLVFKNFPLRNHRMAMPAAKAAMAAAGQGKFWQYHDRIFEHYNKLDDELLKKFAHDLDLDMDKFLRDSKSREVASLIRRDMQEGGRIGVRGTPTVFINGKRLNQRSLQALTAAIEKELKE